MNVSRKSKQKYLFHQIICWQYLGTTMVMEVNCSVSVVVVVQWQKKMYSSKTLELPKSKIVEENISATVAILQWPQKLRAFSSLTTVVSWSWKLNGFFFCGHDRDHGSTVILPADDQAECHHFIIYDFDMDHIYMLKSDIIIYKEKRI